MTNLFKIHSDRKDFKAVKKILRSKGYWAEGIEIKEFENRISKFFGIENTLVLNSGTAALHLVLLAHDVKEKEVIVPTFTFLATANAVVLAGGVPVFAESEPDTLGLDAKSVEGKITEKTKAIIAIHYAGWPSRDIETLSKIAKERNLVLIEDTAEAFGAEYNDKMVGTFGDSAILSFCQNKIITTGEGGAIITKDTSIYNYCRILRSHGKESQKENLPFIKDDDGYNDYNDCVCAGYNYRMPTMLAALGIAQIKKAGKLIELRRKKAKYYDEKLSELKEITLLKGKPNMSPVYQMYTILFNKKETRDDLKSFLEKRGISSKIYFHPVHLEPFYRKEYSCREGDLPATESLSNRVLTLPFYTDIKKSDINKVYKGIKEFFQKT